MAGDERRATTFRASFRSAHPALKLSFSLSVLVALALLVEGGAWLVVRFGLGVRGDEARPAYTLSLSGWRVFQATPGRDLGPGIDGPAVVPDALGLIARGPVARERPPGALRVILTGGSVAAGAGQLPGFGYERVRAWPRGHYAFEASIAGRLEAALARALPGRPVEVIVAAHDSKVALQSYVHYLTALSALSPDYLLHLEGWNDQLVLYDPAAPGVPVDDPWAAWERRWLDPFVALRATEAPRRWSVERLATLLAQRAQACADRGPPPPPDDAPRATDEALRPEYDRVKVGLFVRPAARWLAALDHHLAAVGQDGVRLVFALQPMLVRAANKALSPAEAGFERALRPGPTSTPGDVHAWTLTRWFYDEHLTGELRRRVEARGQVYLDLAEPVRALPASVEVYTDAVHLAPDGNRVVADAFARAVLADLERRGR